MRPVKAGKPLIDVIELCYHANRPILLVGHAGVGKSELLEAAAKSLQISYICRDLSLMEPPDLVGLPKMDGGVTRYLRPSFLPSDGKGIIAFEELNRCPTYMRAPCLQLLTARMLNDYVLPPGWLPVASINPSDDKYDVNELDPALLARFVKVQVVPDKNEWIGWAKGNGVHEHVISYIDRDAKVFNDTSPRDWKYVSDLLQTKEKLTSKEARSKALSNAIAGQVGRERATAFEAFIKGGPIVPPIMDVLKNLPAHRVRIKEWMGQGRTDIFEDYAFSIKSYLQNEDNYRIFRNNAALWLAFAEFLKMIPPDLKEDIVNYLLSKSYDCPI